MKLTLLFWRTHQSGSQLNSATGVRNYLGVKVSELIYDRGALQVFRLRDQPLSVVQALDLEPLLSGPAKAVLRNEPADHQLELVHLHDAGPGDFEMIWDFDPDQAVVLRLDLTSSTGNRRNFILRSYKPFIPGPQRIRFVLDEGEDCRIMAKMETREQWSAVRDITLLRTPVNRR